MLQLDAIDRQNAEFDALDNVVKTYESLSSISVVDDDYSAARHQYESALAVFLKKMVENKRFVRGNRYGLEEV